MVGRRIDLRCDDGHLFDAVLPHETTHVVLADRFPKLELFTLKDVAGDWQKAQKAHFNEGGVFDQIQQQHR